MTHDDALVGLRFELGGGLGRVAGQIVGKAGEVYLIRKDGADYLELFKLDDLRSAKFYEVGAGEARQRDAGAETAAAGSPRRDKQPGPVSESAPADTPPDTISDTSPEQAGPEHAGKPGDKPKLSEQIRRAAALRLNKQE